MVDCTVRILVEQESAPGLRGRRSDAGTELQRGVGAAVARRAFPYAYALVVLVGVQRRVLNLSIQHEGTCQDAVAWV